MESRTKSMSRSVRGHIGRFLSRRKEADGGAKNRRRYNRFSCDLPVELHVETPGHLSIIKAIARDISRGGMLIECSKIPALLSECYVSFRTPEWGPFKSGHNQLVMAKARVQHCNPAVMNFGLAFASAI